MTDLEITALYLQRSETAILESQSKYGALIRRIIGGILQSAEDIEECENDTYLSAWQNIPPSQPRSLKAYLAAIARNTAYNRADYLSAAKRRPEALVSLDELAETLADTSVSGCEDAVLSDIINGFLGKLRYDQRKVFLLRYWAGLPVTEIMKRTGFTKAKTEMMLYRLRNKLRDELKRKGYSYETK
jgi:RNA polymerase sigma-70 factor (ECF subfamily)